jgi:Holliday junction DNA helicase RuvB
LRLDLKRFTLIGATTKVSMLSGPLRDRFGSVFHLDFYTLDEMSSIIRRTAQILGLAIDATPAGLIGSRARRTPRIANRLLKRVRDFAQVRGNGILDEPTVVQALNALEIDLKGLDETDRNTLRVLIEKFNGGPTGLTTIAAALNEDIATLEDVIEPFLLQEGLLDRTPRGRVATDLAYQHLGIKRNTPNLL